MEPEQHRWMYNRNYPNRGGLDEEFIQGVAKFIDYAKSLSQFGDEGTIRCPCGNCKCRKLLKPEIVKFHLYKEGFKEKYHLWTDHEEFEPSVNAHFQNFSDSKVIQWKTSQAKAARASKKDSSLHTEGLVTMRTRRRLVYKRYGSSDEVFPETHAKKKKDGKKVWVESQAEQTYNEYKQSLEKYTRSRSINDQDGQRSFNRQSPRFSGASSSSSQSSVNQDKPEDELEVTRKKLELTQRQLELTQKLLEFSQKSLQKRDDDYKRIDKYIKQLQAQVNWMVKSVKNNNIRLPVSRQIDFDNIEPVNDAVPGDNDV